MRNSDRNTRPGRHAAPSSDRPTRKGAQQAPDPYVEYGYDEAGGQYAEPVYDEAPRRRTAPARNEAPRQPVRRKRKKKKKLNTTALLLVLVVLFGVIFGYSAYRLYSIMSEYSESRERYNSVADSAMSTVAPVSAVPTTAPFAVNPGEEITASPVTEKSPIDVNFTTLLEQSPDIIGWIYCADTVINYPMVRGNDNDYYLHRFIDGSYNGGGTLFMDCKCSRDFSSANSIVYGHNMNDGSMFASLKKYRNDPEYYSKHPTFYINTPTQNYRVDVFAGFVCDADSDTYTISFASDTGFESWLSRMVAQSDFKTEVSVGAGDHIITLSTCSYEWYDARYVVLGKLVPIG